MSRTAATDNVAQLFRPLAPGVSPEDVRIAEAVVFASAEPVEESAIATRLSEGADVAAEKLGPYWRGGYIWVVHASVCEPDARPVPAADVAAALATIRLDRYDPLGNLRAPSNDTVYSAGQ